MKSLSVFPTRLLACALLLLPILQGCTDKKPLKVETGEVVKPGEEGIPEQILISPSGPYPKVVVAEDEHNFGTMQVTTTLNHKFLVKNEGEAVLKLKKDRSTCKCTMAEFGYVELEPGGETEIELSWIGKVEDPAFRQSAFIKTNDPENEEIELTVTGAVVFELTLEPQGVWHLGTLSDEQPTPFSGLAYSLLYDEFELNLSEPSSDKVTVKATPMTAEKLKELGAKSGYEITGEVKTGIPVGEFEETFKVTSSVFSGASDFTIKGVRSGPLQVIGNGWIAAKNLVMLGKQKVSDSKGKAFSIYMKTLDDLPDFELKLLEYESKPYDMFDVEITRDEKFKAEGRDRYFFKVKVRPDSPIELFDARRNAATISMKLNHPEVEQWNIFVGVETQE